MRHAPATCGSRIDGSDKAPAGGWLQVTGSVADLEAVASLSGDTSVDCTDLLFMESPYVEYSPQYSHLHPDRRRAAQQRRSHDYLCRRHVGTSVTRVANQSKRIHQEVKEGELTHAQAASVRNNDRQIRAEKSAMASRNSGHFTKSEQKVLNQQENAVIKRIGQ